MYVRDPEIDAGLAVPKSATGDVVQQASNDAKEARSVRKRLRAQRKMAAETEEAMPTEIAAEWNQPNQAKQDIM